MFALKGKADTSLMHGVRPARTRSSNKDAAYCGALGCDWHLASFRCGAKVQTLLEVKRTCRDRRELVDLAKMTHLRHGRLKTFAAQKHCSFLR
jgi:hypothetical protein